MEPDNTSFYSAHSQPICYASSAKSFAIAFVNRTVQIFNHSTAQHATTFQTEHTHNIASLKLKNNLLVTGGYDGIVSIWDERQNKKVHTFNSI